MANEEFRYSDYVHRVNTPAEDQPAEQPASEPKASPKAKADAAETEQPSGFSEVVKRLFGGDRVLWVIIIVLMTISVLVVYSSTAKMAYMPRSSTTPAEYLRSQLIMLVGGVVFMFAVHRINSKVYRASSVWMWLLALGLTGAVYFMGGSTINDAARWFPIFGFKFQPSEMLKITIVMYLARQLAKRQKTITTMEIVPSINPLKWSTARQRKIWADGGRYIFLPIVLSCMFILPAHTSSAAIVFLLSLAMLYIARVRWRDIFRLIGWAVTGLALVFLLNIGRGDTASNRITTWIDLWTTSRMDIPAEDLSDTERSMIAIHNGGLLGRGAGQSTVRVEMTHPESDYAFAFFAEEYGIGLAMILIALYVWIFFRAIEIFEKCPKRYPALLSLGLAILITGQALVHIMVTVNILPETGQTLPLISRGGSSLIFTCVALGMILSVSRQTEEGSHSEDN